MALSDRGAALTYVVIELGDAETWVQPAWAPGRIIPDRRRPSMLQPDRETAEKEALRLAGLHPDRRFVVFAPIAAGVTVKVPTHVTMSGKVVCERAQAALASIDDPDEIPF